MPVRIRLQRHGKKGKPFYWIIAADSRAKRDGKYLEKLGTYNPNSNPAQIDLDLNASVQWLKNGAQPSETARRILSYKGAMLKFHLMGGIAKGALTEAQAEEKFQAWLDAKTQKIDTKKTTLTQKKEHAKAQTLKVEKEISEKRNVVAQPTEEPASALDPEAAPKETVTVAAIEQADGNNPEENPES